MAFDPEQPKDTTKIRNLGVVIRPNWEAIEEGDTSFGPYSVNLQDRTPLAVSNDPGAMTTPNACRVFCKQDGSGNPELYAIDPSGNVIQFTQGGLLGSSNTDVIANNLQVGGDTFNNSSFITAFGFFNVSGTLVAGTNMSTSGSPNPSPGRYNVNVDADVLTSANYTVLITPDISGDTTRCAVNARPAPSGGSPTTIQVEVGDSSLKNTPFNIAVLGGV